MRINTKMKMQFGALAMAVATMSSVQAAPAIIVPMPKHKDVPNATAPATAAAPSRANNTPEIMADARTNTFIAPTSIDNKTGKIIAGLEFDCTHGLVSKFSANAGLSTGGMVPYVHLNHPVKMRMDATCSRADLGLKRDY